MQYGMVNAPCQPVSRFVSNRQLLDDVLFVGCFASERWVCEHATVGLVVTIPCQLHAWLPSLFIDERQVAAKL